MSELVLQRRYGVEDLGEERLRLIVGSVTGAMPTDEIIIFGSYARGEATDESDVDILVLTPHTSTPGLGCGTSTRIQTSSYTTQRSSRGS